VIWSFKGKVAEQAFKGKCLKGFPADLLRVSRRKLEAVNAAVQLEDQRVPPAITSRLSLAIGRDNIRSGSTTSSESAFAGSMGGAEDVEIVDYHRRPA
jgi:toxin HigB-1